VGEWFTSGFLCFQGNYLACEYYITFCFSRGGVVSTSPNSQAGGPPLAGCPRLLIQCIRSCPPSRRPFLHPRPEDAPCRGDRDPQNTTDHSNSLINRRNTGLSLFSLVTPNNAAFSYLTSAMCLTSIIHHRFVI
jgi:hypothetical protein